MVLLAGPPTRMDPQPLSRALCSRGSHHCYTVTVLIVVCLSDLATKRQKRGVGLLGGVSLTSRQSRTDFKSVLHSEIKALFIKSMI